MRRSGVRSPSAPPKLFCFQLSTRRLQLVRNSTDQNVTNSSGEKLRLLLGSAVQRINPHLVIYMRANSLSAMWAVEERDRNLEKVTKRRPGNAEVGGSSHRQNCKKEKPSLCPG